MANNNAMLNIFIFKRSNICPVVQASPQSDQIHVVISMLLRNQKIHAVFSSPPQSALQCLLPSANPAQCCAPRLGEPSK